MPDAAIQTEQLAAALRAAHPELDALRAAGMPPVYVVGGAVRDLLLGRGRADLDLVVVGDPAALATRLGAEPLAAHARFATATLALDGQRVDVAAARTETYPEPGALPVVAPAADVESDLARRDFTINAMAIPLAGEPRLIDPHGGRADLEAGRLRALHARSFLDDPTRAIRAARYAARFGFAPEPQTARLLRGADFGSVSEQRSRAELSRLATEASAPHGLQLLAEWGLVEPRPGGIELAAAVARLLEEPPWAGFAPRAATLLAAALGPAGGEAELAAASPEKPSRAVALAAGRSPAELALARALGGGWLDRYLAEWRGVALAIDGSDLLAAGIPQGPGIGRGLAAALRAKLDGEVSGREAELAAALRAI